MELNISNLLIFILSLILTILVGESVQINANELPKGGFKDTFLTRLMRQAIELFRHGLIDADVENWSVPDVDWKIDNRNFFGLVHIMDVKVTGLTGFNVRNLSGSLTKMILEIDIEAPLVEITGNYDMEGEVLGIPITGNGFYSLKLSKVEIKGGSKLKTGVFGTKPSVEILNPMINVKGIGLTFDGPLDSASLTKLILIAWALLLLYTGVIVGVTLLCKKITTKLKQRRLSGFGLFMKS